MASPPSDPNVTTVTNPRASVVTSSVPENDDNLYYLETASPPSSSSLAAAKFRANSSVRFVKKLGHNAVKKVEDVGIGLLGVTDVIAEAGEGVGRTAVSGVGAVGSVVEGGVVGALSISKGREVVRPREVDTVTDVDISGTVLKDLNRAIEVEKMKGTSNAESPLNTPWILMIFPVMPIAFMYTKTAVGLFLPPFLHMVYVVWTFFGWRFWFCLVLLSFLVTIVAWETIKGIEPLRPITMQVDVAAIQLRRRISYQTAKQMPKIYKALDRIFPPITAAFVTLDRLLTPKLGYSPLLAVNAKLNGWIYDPNISEIRIEEDPDTAAARGTVHSDYSQPNIRPNLSGKPVIVQKRDRGQVVVLSEGGVVQQQQGGGGLEFDAERVAERVVPAIEGAGEIFEQFFNVEICLRDLSELHRKYTSVWVEWLYRGMVVDRSVIRDVTNSTEWKGMGTSFDDYTLKGEVRLPLRAHTTEVDGGFYDIPIRLILKGRDGLPIYANDGARRYMRDSPPICTIGEIELSALRIGVGTDTTGIVRSELRIPLHAVGVSQYRAAVVRASSRISPVDSSSYSYRQMLSPLPNGEWTVRVNVFELRNLRGVDNSGSSDPYVSASVMGMVKKTNRQRQTLSCMVNQLLFFSKLCTGLEFENEKIIVEVMDWNRVSAPKKIGVYTLDAKRMLELPGREMYRKWFALQDPNGGKRPSGFIKMSITVVPPGGTPPHHQEAEDSEEFSSANLLKNTVLKTPKMSYQNWAVHITVGWADMLPHMASQRYRDSIRGYVTFNYSGWEDCKTNTFITEAKEVVDRNIGTACRVSPQRRVIWNEEYILPLTIINDRVAQEGISLKLFHKIMPRLQEPLRSDQLIGQVNVSFEELFKNLTTAVVRGDPADGEDDGDRVREVALMKPRYYNFYGKPEGMADPYDKGVAFRGRVLIGVAAKPGDVAEPFLRPCPPPPRPKLEFYKMTFCILRATELPLADGWSVFVEVRIGLYQFGHTIPKAVAHNSCAEWDENCAVSIPNMQFPEDVEQIPDIFVTIWGRKPSTVEELEERMASDGEDDVSRESISKENGPISTEDATGATEITPPPLNGVKVTSGDTDGAQPAAAPEPIGDTGGTNDGQWQPKAFVRLPAKHLICGQQDPRWMFMDYPGNDVLASKDQVPGSVLLSASLSRCDPTREESAVEEVTPLSPPLGVQGRKVPEAIAVPESLRTNDAEDEVRAMDSSQHLVTRPAERRASVSDHIEMYASAKSDTYSIPLGAERSYTLRAMIWKGRNLPAADESGLSDPVVMVSMGDKREKGEVVCRQTVAPLWQELIEIHDIKVRDGERKPNVNILIFDYDGEGNPMDYLGRSIVPCAELDTAPPSLQFSSWYPVFSVNPGVTVGEVLADFQLIPSNFAKRNPMRPLPSPSRSESALRISLVGLRDVKFLQYASGDLFVECSISGETVSPGVSKTGAILQQRAYEANCNILDVLLLAIKIPDDLRLAPALNIYAYANYHHLQAPDLVATACIPLEKWLSEHNRRLVTGESLIDDSFGTDAPVPKRLTDNGRGYCFRRNAKRAGEEPIGAASRLHEVKSREGGERKNMLVLQEKNDVLRVGFAVEKNGKEGKSKDGAEIYANKKEGGGVGEKIFAVLAPIRAMKYQIADTLADLMPDVSMALGIEVDEDVPLSALRGDDGEQIDYDGTLHLKRDRGFCPMELETDFSEPAYGEFLLFRGDNRALGNTVGRLDNTEHHSSGNQGFPPILPLDEVQSSAALVKREKRRAALEGARPAVGKVKARLDLVEMDAEVDDEVESKKVRMTSLRSFGRVFMPTEVVVRVYVLRGINLQQIGSQCNPYLTARFYGGYPDFYSQKYEPVIDDGNPNFFCMFESRVKMPGGSVRIEVKDRVLPEVTVPVSYPMYIKDEGRHRLGMVQRDIPVNVGRLGLGWSESIGETVIDLDARWYNSAWRSLLRTPVEQRSLYSEESANLKGQLEMFVDVFDAKEYDKRPKLYKAVPISAPPQEAYVLRIVVYKIAECTLPYKLANNDPAKLAAFYVQVRLGNREQDDRRTDLCRHVADGFGEFNHRLKWDLMLPSMEVKPRLKFQIFDDTSHGFGDDQMCATADIKLRSLFDEICMSKKAIMKKRQWVVMEHPNHPDVQARVQISLELTTAELARKKKCLVGKDGWSRSQHEDYVLPVPFQPKVFSLYNPVPYFNYLIVSMVNNLQWQLATVLLIFPFMPMFVQFVFMLTPWQWYAAGGAFGLIVLIRLSMVSASKAARMQAELEAAKADAASVSAQT